MSNLVLHAERELKRAGLFDKDSDYGGMLGNAVLDLVRAFAVQGHSGFSAERVRELFHVLSDFKPLTPITSDPCEWADVSELSGYPHWQNIRKSSSFSYDGGKTWWDVDDPEETMRGGGRP